ncbi:unnamed protein product (mitochondrion) [Plasmodiophora brassicae]|uniref:PrsW family intramembrane metalloprotease n=1 Tax=Plasmodiophora brassicae TaxID=37360 RepID=A0A0G4IR29_PLABS|nr:hypothetical protein PBRA_005819 [Plasmodiophora brassicae]SPQ98248.1 unnamed protein product [Plasmodiophora brassicae]
MLSERRAQTSPGEQFCIATLWALLVVALLAIAVASRQVVPVAALCLIAFVPTALLFAWAGRCPSPDIRRVSSPILQMLYWRGFIFVFVPAIPELIVSIVLVPGLQPDLQKSGAIASYLIGQFLIMAVAPGVFEELYKWWLTSFAIRSWRRREPDAAPTRSQIMLFGMFGALGFLTVEDLLYTLTAYASGDLASAAVTIGIRVALFPIHVSLGIASAKAIARQVADDRSPFKVRWAGIWRQMAVHGLYNFSLTIGLSSILLAVSAYFALLLVIPLVIGIVCAVYLFLAVREMSTPSPAVVVVAIAAEP